jgi:NADPH-dependent ferric siderophore reductase
VHPRLRRVVLHAPGIAALALPATGDVALGIHFSTPDNALAARTYTVRRHDTATGAVTVDVVLHGDAVGTRWALTAAEGDTVELAHARSWYRPPPEADTHLLAADLAGLPALARILDEGPSKPTTAVVEVLDRHDLDYLPKRRGVEYISSCGTGNGRNAGALARLVAEQPVTDRSYCWFAGEASQARAVRKFFRGQQNWPLDQLDVMGYWRRDAEEWNRRFEPLGPRMFESYQQAIADGQSEKVALERYDDELERLGL